MIAVFCNRGGIAVCDGKDRDAKSGYFPGDIADGEKIAREGEKDGEVSICKVLQMELRFLEISQIHKGCIKIKNL